MKYDEFNSSDAAGSAKHYVLKDDDQCTKKATAAEADVGSIIPEIISDSSEPLPPEQVADFSDLEDGKKSLEEKCSEKENSPLDPPGSLITLSSEEFKGVPIPPAQIAIHEKAMEAKQMKESTSNDISSKPALGSQNVKTSDQYNSSSTQTANSSNNVQRALAKNTIGDLQYAQQSNIRVIEATLVEEEPAPPVYNAVLVPEQVEQNLTGNDNGEPGPESDMQQDEFKEPNNNAFSFWKRHKLAVSLGILAILLFGGLMATVGAFLTSSNDDSIGIRNGSDVRDISLPVLELSPSPEPIDDQGIAGGNKSKIVTDDEVSVSPTLNPSTYY